MVGFQRCFEVSRDFALKKGAPTDDASLLQDVVQHCHDKLFLLEKLYIATAEGKAAAAKQTVILCEELVKRGVAREALVH